MARLAVDVSRETLSRLEAYLQQLRRWQRSINLVSASTLDDAWRRHVLDSAQLIPLLPAACDRLVDLGTGSGLPGLVIAAHRPDISVTLVDSDTRKGAFLLEAARHMSLANAKVSLGRIEKLPPSPSSVVTARALAPLASLLEWARPWCAEDGIFLFHKGIRYDDELTEARRTWMIEADTIPSIVGDGSVILRIRHAAKRSS